MTVFTPEIETEYERWIALVEEDPYASPTTMGIHDVLKAHFLIIDYFITERNGEGVGGIGPKDIDRLHSAVYRHLTAKNFISLCCNTDYKSFGGEMSRKAICNSFVAPFREVHGAVASQFCQTYLAHHLLEGVRPSVAFARARLAVPGGTSFRLWQGGKKWTTNT